jgi:hypothetical protein
MRGFNFIMSHKEILLSTASLLLLLLALGLKLEIKSGGSLDIGYKVPGGATSVIALVSHALSLGANPEALKKAIGSHKS